MSTAMELIERVQARGDAEKAVRGYICGEVPERRF